MPFHASAASEAPLRETVKATSETAIVALIVPEVNRLKSFDTEATDSAILDMTVPLMP